MGQSSDPRGGYETFEHTADVGLRVWATDMRGLLEHAAAGVIGVMFEPGRVRVADELQVAALGNDAEELLVAWLEEVLFAFEGRRFAPAAARVDRLEAGRAQGVLLGEPYDPARHEVRQAVKAVTYHALKVERTARGLEVRIVLDV